MKEFALLYRHLISTTRPAVKLTALTGYLKIAHPEDRLWAIALCLDKRPPRILTSSLLRQWVIQECDIPLWLFEECHKIVGDVTESVSLTLPLSKSVSKKPLSTWMQSIINQKGKSEAEIKKFLLLSWRELEKEELLIFNKVVTGSLRTKVSPKVVTRAVATAINREESKVAHRIINDWSPLTKTYDDLLIDNDWQNEASIPYPFYLPSSIENEIETLGSTAEWTAEWLWKGMRSQLIKRDGQLFIWSRHEELITERFPEFAPLKDIGEDGFVLDVIILVFQNDGIQSSSFLQKRLSRQRISKKLVKDFPVAMVAYDLLEINGLDIRRHSLSYRRAALTELLSTVEKEMPGKVLLSDVIPFDNWDFLDDLRQSARSMRAGGLMLKSTSGNYKEGRVPGEWWKWKVSPHTIKAVLLYAQKEQGVHSNLYATFTFAVRNNRDEFIPFVKTGSGLEKSELEEITKFVSKNTIEKFGPVRSVKPELVFEISFTDINESSRHKCGLQVQDPHIMKWLREGQEADSLELLRSLLF